MNSFQFPTFGLQRTAALGSVQRDADGVRPDSRCSN